MVSPVLLVVVLAMVALAAIPTRRLADAGLPAGLLLTYLLVVVFLGVATYLGAPARFAIPILAVIYVAPLVIPPDLLGRLLRRRPGPPGSPGGRRGPRPVGSGTGRTVRPDGTLAPDDQDRDAR